MTESITNDDRQLDDLLAEYTDRVLAGERPAVPDEVLGQFSETVLQLQRLCDVGEQPDAAIARRIYNRLVDEWQINFSKKPESNKRLPGWLIALRVFLRKNLSGERKLATGFVAVMALIVLAVIIWGSGLTAPLAGSAGQGENWLPLLILLGLALLAGFGWYWRSRR